MNREMHNDNHFDELLTAEQLAEKIGLHPGSILRMARDGRIPSYRSGHQVVRFKLIEVLNAMKGKPEVEFDLPFRIPNELKFNDIEAAIEAAKALKCGGGAIVWHKGFWNVIPVDQLKAYGF